MERQADRQLRVLLQAQHRRGGFILCAEHDRVQLCLFQFGRHNEQRSGGHCEREVPPDEGLEPRSGRELRLELQQGPQIHPFLKQRNILEGPLRGGLSDGSDHQRKICRNSLGHRTLSVQAPSRRRDLLGHRPQQGRQLQVLSRHDHSPVHRRFQPDGLLETAQAERQRSGLSRLEDLREDALPGRLLELLAFGSQHRDRPVAVQRPLRQPSQCREGQNFPMDHRTHDRGQIPTHLRLLRRQVQLLVLLSDGLQDRRRRLSEEQFLCPHKVHHPDIFPARRCGQETQDEGPQLQPFTEQLLHVH